MKISQWAMMLMIMIQSACTTTQLSIVEPVKKNGIILYTRKYDPWVGYYFEVPIYSSRLNSSKAESVINDDLIMWDVYNTLSQNQEDKKNEGY